MNLLKLLVTLGVDKTEFDNGINDTVNSAKGLGGAIKNAMKVGAAAVAAVTTATVALTKSFVNSAGEVASYGDNIDKMSQKMGISAEAYQEWDAILQHSGSSIESLLPSMKTLSVAAENGSDAFAALGISEQEIANMNQEELFSRVIAELQNMEEGTERTAIASKLLGRGATELGALLNTSAEDTEAMRQRVHELGGVMSDEAVKSAAAYQDTLQDMQTAFSGLKRGLVSDFMPAISTVMGGLTEIFSGDSESGLAMISEGIDSIVSDITDKLPQFLEVGTKIISALINAFIDNFPKILEMGGELIGEFIAGIISNIPQLILQIPKIVKAIIDGLVAAWPSIRDAGMDIIKVIGDGIKQAVSAAKEWGSDLIKNFLDGIKAKWQALKDGIANVANTIKDFLGFSEPEKGPLSNFHTYAPDMMELFAKGIRDNADLIKDSFDDALDLGSPEMVGNDTPKNKKTGGYERVGNDAREIVINLIDEIDGAVFARKSFRYFVNEGIRLGEPITNQGV